MPNPDIPDHLYDKYFGAGRASREPSSSYRAPRAEEEAWRRIGVSVLVTAGLVLLGFLISNHGSTVAGILGAALLLLLIVMVGIWFWEFVGETLSGLVAWLIPIAVLAIIVLT